MNINEPTTPLTAEEIDATNPDTEGPGHHNHFFFGCTVCMTENNLAVMYCQQAQAISITCTGCGDVVASVRVASKEHIQ